MSAQKHQRFTISVVIPCHNCGAYLSEAVNSVMQQRGPFSIEEIVVVDDRSDDDSTLEVLAELSHQNGVRVCHNSGPKGAAAARNAGIRASSSEWIAFLDGDDLLGPDSIEVRVQAANRFPGANWIGGNWVAVDSGGTALVSTAENPVKGRGIDVEPRGEEYEMVRAAFESGVPVLLPRPVPTFVRRSISLTSTHLLRRSLLFDVGLYDESLLTSEDRDLYIRLARISDFVFVPKPIFYYRQHSDNTTTQEHRMLDGRLQMLRKLHADPQFAQYRDVIRSKAYDVAMSHAYYHRDLEMYGCAIESARWAVALRPGEVAAWKNLVAAVLRN